jgi:hypothetical protein
MVGQDGAVYTFLCRSTAASLIPVEPSVVRIRDFDGNGYWIATGDGIVADERQVLRVDGGKPRSRSRR